MTMRYRLLVAALLLPIATAGAAQTPAWVSDEVGETPDPAVRYAELPNGFRVAIMRNTEPKGVAVVEYRIAAGTAQEGPQEREFAHLVEHLAFGVTTAFPKGDAIPQLQAAGLQLGNDVNGFTTARGTVYSLSIPQVSADRLALALRFMRGFSDGEAFDANEVERQKGVVTAEIAGGENQSVRAGRALRKQLYPELPFLWEVPAARVASVRGATAERLRAFHDRWYRPDTGFLVIVGDVDPGETLRAVEAAFASWKRPAVPLPATPTPQLVQRAPTASVAQESGLSDIITIAVAKPQASFIPTRTDRRDFDLTLLGMSIVRDRLERQLLNDPQVPISSISSNTSRWPAVVQSYTFSAALRPGKWREALTLIDQETRRPIVSGFTVPEVDRSVTSALKGARAASARASSRTSTELAVGIVGAYADRVTFTLPERNFQRLSEVLNAATPTDILAAYRAAWGELPPAIALSGSEGLPTSGDLVASAYKLAHASTLPPRDLALAVGKQLPLPGPAGTVAERHRIADLGVETVRFANGVRLNVKHTDFRTGEVLTTLRLGGGLLSLPPGQRLVAPPLSMLLLGGAAGLSAEQIVEGMRGSQVSGTTGALGTDVIQFSGQNNPASLPDQLRLWEALIGAPEFDTRADALVQARVRAGLDKLDATAQASFQRHWYLYSRGGDPRFAPLEPADAAQLSMAQARRIYGPILKDAPLEITIVGDVDVDRAIAATAQTLGALPPRRTQALKAEGPEPRLPAPGETIVWTHRGDAGRALVASVWKARDSFDPKDGAPQAILAAVLQSRLFNDLRQTSGATYSPGQLYEASPRVRGFGYIGTVVEVAVGDVPLAERSLRTIATSLAELGPSAEEFERVSAPLRSRAALNQRTNSWWLNALDWTQTQPDALDRARLLEPRLKAVTLDEVKALAAEVFGAPPIKVEVMPQQTAKP